VRIIRTNVSREYLQKSTFFLPKKSGLESERHLEEVGNEGSRGDHVGLVGDGVEDLELLIVVLVDLQDGRLVSASVAIVRRGPNGHQSLIEVELESLVDKLMRAANKLQSIHVAELLGDLGAEEPASTAL